jgi:hypothetical protein
MREIGGQNWPTDSSGCEPADATLLVIAGSEAGSLWHSQELYAKAAGPKELFIIDGATHMDLYHGAGAGLAMDKLSPFFKSNLQIQCLP